MMGFFEHGNETSGCIKGGKYLDQVSNVWLYKTDLMHGVEWLFRDTDVLTMQVLVPPGFGQDVREWQTKKQLFSSYQTPTGADTSRPPSSLDCPMSPADVPRLTVKEVDRHRADDIWEGENGEQLKSGK